MAQIRCQVEIARSEALPEDTIVNVVYFDTDNPDPFADPTGIAEDVRDAFLDNVEAPTDYRCRVKAYLNPGAGDTGPPDRVTSWATGFQGAATGCPREVALCLSYYAGSNVPRKRGRIYVGPWSGSIQERPSDGQLTAVLDLGTALAGIGGIDVAWVQYSPTTGDFSNVTSMWCDDEWDTQRRRGTQPTKRLTRST